MSQSGSTTPQLDALSGLFYADRALLGRFQQVSAADMPSAYQTLLAHQNHMTVTVERFHGGPVDVRVLQTRREGDLYSRKIVLALQSDGRVVQFGIVRLNFACVSDEVRREIESERIPVGRVLIQHQVLREIHLLKLFRVEPGPDLAALFGASQSTYGRTATIDFDCKPAVELIEIVAPVEA